MVDGVNVAVGMKPQACCGFEVRVVTSVGDAGGEEDAGVKYVGMRGEVVFKGTGRFEASGVCDFEGCWEESIEAVFRKRALFSGEVIGVKDRECAVMLVFTDSDGPGAICARFRRGDLVSCEDRYNGVGVVFIEFTVEIKVTCSQGTQEREEEQEHKRCVRCCAHHEASMA